MGEDAPWKRRGSPIGKDGAIGARVLPWSKDAALGARCGSGRGCDSGIGGKTVKAKVWHWG